MRRFLIVTMLIASALLTACGEQESGDPIGIPPTPLNEEPAVDATNAIYEPAANSPDELGTPQADSAEEMDTGSERDPDIPFEESPEDIFGYDIPLPEGATLVEVDNPDDQRYSKASYTVAGTSIEAVRDFYLEALPEAGFLLQEESLTTGADAETVRFERTDGEAGGLISIVDAADTIRVTISTGSIDE